MSSYYTQQKSLHLCVDWERAVHPGSERDDQAGFMMYPNEMESSSNGPADETQYKHDREVACAVCSPQLSHQTCKTLPGVLHIDPEARCLEDSHDGDKCR